MASRKLSTMTISTLNTAKTTVFHRAMRKEKSLKMIW